MKKLLLCISLCMSACAASTNGNLPAASMQSGGHREVDYGSSGDPFTLKGVRLLELPPADVSPKSVGAILNIPRDAWKEVRSSSGTRDFGGFSSPAIGLRDYSIGMSFIDAAHSGMNLSIWWSVEARSAGADVGCLDNANLEAALHAKGWKQFSFGTVYPSRPEATWHAMTEQLRKGQRLLTARFGTFAYQKQKEGCITLLNVSSNPTVLLMNPTEE
jgi:hypothetical protein